MATDEYTISQSGTVLGKQVSDAVTISQNQVTPNQRETTIISFLCPENYEEINFTPSRDAFRFYPRVKETFDGDGSTTTFGLTADVIATAGEPEIVDQPEPAVVACVAGSQVDIASIDYNTDEVTLESAPATGTGNVQLFPLLTEGTIKARGVNTLDQVQGPLYPWTHPVYRWADVDQDKRGTEVNLPWPAFSWERNETMEVMLDSPRQIVWEDSDYPGAFVSRLEIDVQITY